MFSFRQNLANTSPISPIVESLWNKCRDIFVNDSDGCIILLFKKKIKKKRYRTMSFNYKLYTNIFFWNTIAYT